MINLIRGVPSPLKKERVRERINIYVIKFNKHQRKTKMTPELLLTIIQISIGLFALVIIILLLIPKCRKQLSELQPEPRRKQRGLGLANGIEVIFYPIYWLIKIVIAIFK